MSTILKEAKDKKILNNQEWSGIFDVTSDLTLETLGLYTMSYAAGAKGAEPHYHKKMMEIFNVLEGAVSVLINGTWSVVEAGGTVVIPTMIIHAFKPLADRACKIQILFTPNIKREEFFLDFHLYANATDKEKFEFWAKYDQYPPHTHPGQTKISDINYSEGYDSRVYAYSQGVLVSSPQEILYISGQVGISIPNEQKSFAEQIDLAYENMEKVLVSANMTFANVVKVTELVVGNSLDKLGMVNNKKKQIFQRYPSSTYIPVDSLALPGMLFEIEAIAVR